MEWKLVGYNKMTCLVHGLVYIKVEMDLGPIFDILFITF